MKLVARTLLRIAVALCGLALMLRFVVGIFFSDKRPAIYFAALKGDTNYLTRFIARGGDVNRLVVSYRSGHRYAPLLDIALQNGNLSAVDLLLKAGASPNQPDSAGNAPLIWTIGYMGNEVPLEERIQIFNRLIKAGADPNMKSSSEYQYTPLLEASSLGNTEMVKLLIAVGADVNATNRIGQSALHLANNVEIARQLLAAGANPMAEYRYSLPSYNGDSAATVKTETPADTARRAGRFDVLELLTNKAMKQISP